MRRNRDTYTIQINKNIYLKNNEPVSFPNLTFIYMRLLIEPTQKLFNI